MAAGGILPVPHVPKRGRKAPPPGTAPCRNRRLAGVGVEPLPPPPPSARPKKKVMLALDIVDQHEQVDEQALEEYATLFKHQLSDSHIKALAALFGWSPPTLTAGTEPPPCYS
uniref:Uncharacterized protein n=1 Tax=Arundo donax TaxID=35708 RepID=A0A0A9B4A1_ARUDO